jgi:hypothetical protein
VRDADTPRSDAGSEEEVLPDWGHDESGKPPLKLGKVPTKLEADHSQCCMLSLHA